MKPAVDRGNRLETRDGCADWLLLHRDSDASTGCKNF